MCLGTSHFTDATFQLSFRNKIAFNGCYLASVGLFFGGGGTFLFPILKHCTPHKVKPLFVSATPTTL